MSATAEQIVESALRGRPGLEGAIHAIVAQVLSKRARPSADLSDDEISLIRQTWTDELPAEEAMTQAGLLGKRTREEGGGYCFLRAAVAEYLIYRHLARSRPAHEKEDSYWARCATPAPVFPEYAGAFAWLMRDWAARGCLSLVGPLAEAAAPWLSDVLISFLVEQARTEGAPVEGSQSVAGALAESGSTRTAEALDQAGYQLMETQFASAGSGYFQACVTIRESLWAFNPESVDVGDSLGRALNNLGILLRAAGLENETEQAFARAVRIYEALWVGHPDHLGCGVGLGKALNNLGSVLREGGRVTQGEQACDRSLQIWEALWAANPRNVGIGVGLGRALNNAGELLSEAGSRTEAEQAYRRAVQIEEGLWAAHPDLAGIGANLAATLNSLGILLHEEGRLAEAEQIYRRAVLVSEAIWIANPDHVGNSECLGSALNNLGVLLSNVGQEAEAEKLFQKAARVRPDPGMSSDQ